MKLIPLTQGKFAKVDDEDYEMLMRYKWWVDATGYAITSPWDASKHSQGKKIRMHRLIMDAKDGEMIDHINGERLDNQRINLRFCNKAQNMANSKKMINCSSIYKGVSWSKRHMQWRSYIIKNDIQIEIGFFKEEHHAAMARDIAAKELFGEFANLNFK